MFSINDLLLIFIVYAKQTVKPAPAKKTFGKSDPAHKGDEKVSPRGIIVRSPRAKPPKRERKPQNSVQFS